MAASTRVSHLPIVSKPLSNRQGVVLTDLQSLCDSSDCQQNFSLSLSFSLSDLQSSI